MKVDAKRLSSVLRIWLPFLCWAAFIFFLSHRPAEAFKSSRIPWLDQLYALLGTLHFDKLVHFFLFLVLERLAKKPFQNPFHRILVCLIYAYSDEFHQRFVPGRNFDYFDICADSVGILFFNVKSFIAKLSLRAKF